MQKLTITKSTINFSTGIDIWTCLITDYDGKIYSAKSWDSAKGAYRLAQMRYRVGGHSPAMYHGVTCVHLDNISSRIAKIFIYGTERVVYRNALDVGYEDNCYVNTAYGGYRY